ncbi:MAG: hypothetical protein KGD61_09650, partial [Candidatus Lokiarchaeota archaeon]|nr:hypothetical protein [Candidatus Lokiarchaeota archaeon]
YVSYKKAEGFYTLESGIEKSSSTIIKHENPIYKTIRRVTGRRWGGLVVVQLKRFLRKKANIARIAYIVGLLGFITWFMSQTGDEEDFFNVITSTMLIGVGGGMASIIIGHMAFVDSKDIIWVYKRSPRGINAVVYSYLLAMLIFNVFLAIFETILLTILGNLSTLNAVIFFIEFLLFAQLSMVQAMALQCFSPAFGEKDSNMKGNAMISMLLLQPVMFIPIGLRIFLRFDDLALLRLITQGLLFLYITGVSLPLLYFGMKKLNKLE